MKGEPIVILLVEDDPAHTEIIKRTFEESRLANRLISVEDGQAALDYLHRKGKYQ
jgi:CheY-like chemotaxis protein